MVDRVDAPVVGNAVVADDAASAMAAFVAYV
jgi:hypothetical protein